MSISATDASSLTDEQKDDLARTIGALDVLEALNGDTIAKMEAIDQQITYRRYYFPGSEVKLKIEVKDSSKYNDTNEIAYVEEQWDSTVFDPRYIKSYIDMARQEGFCKHVVMPDNDKFHEASFNDIYKIISDYIDMYNDDAAYGYLYYVPNASTKEKEEIKSKVLGAFAAMNYFDKWNAFFKQYRDDVNKSDIQEVMQFYKKQITKMIYKIEDLVGQSMDEFIENDYGWMAPIQYAFDCEKYVTEYNKYEQEYNEYRDKLWEILSNCDAISITGNRISGTFVATGGSEITITQMNEVEQALREANKAVQAEEAKPKDTTPVTPSEPTTPSTPATPSIDEPKETSPTIEPTPAAAKNGMNREVKITLIIVGVLFLFLIITAIIVRSKTRPAVPMQVTPYTAPSTQSIDSIRTTL